MSSVGLVDSIVQYIKLMPAYVRVSMFFTRHIPQELCDEIIDHVYDDVPTLLACATTCRSWVWRSQKNIFRVVSVNNAARFERFTRLVKSSERLASYVRVLTIAKARRSKTKLDKGWPELLSKLPHIEELTLGRWLDLFPMDDAFQRSLPIYLQHVRVLRISDSFAGCGEEFARFLAACPKLRRIDLDNARMWPSVDQESVLKWPALSECLDALFYRPTHASGPILRFWISSPLAANIRKLEIELATPVLYRDCESLLSATRDRLEELSLSVSGKKVPKRQLIRFTPMPLMKRLRRIHLKTKMIELEKPVARRYEWMLRFLDMLDRWEGKGGLQEIILSWRTSDLMEMESTPPWKLFDIALVGLAKANPKLQLILNVLDNSGIPNQWFYIACIGLQLFPCLQNEKTTLFVNMGSSWSQDEIFGGCLGNSKQSEFSYPCFPIVKALDDH